MTSGLVRTHPGRKHEAIRNDTIVSRKGVPNTKNSSRELSQKTNRNITHFYMEEFHFANRIGAADKSELNDLVLGGKTWNLNRRPKAYLSEVEVEVVEIPSTN